MSILAFLHRILSLRKTRYVVYVLYVIVTGFMVICFCLVCFQCTPVRAFWSKAILKPGSYKCLPLGHVLSFVNLSNAVIDVVILVVPIPVIMKIQLQRKEKIIVVLIFAVGGL